MADAVQALFLIAGVAVCYWLTRDPLVTLFGGPAIGAIPLLAVELWRTRR